MNADEAKAIYHQLLLIRDFEEKVADRVAAGEIRTPCHLYIGQEAIAVGVCAGLKPADYVFGNHRSHGHFLAKGGDPMSLMAEIYCRTPGCSHGRGGSMHLAAPEIGILGTTPIVAASIPLAVGAALASQLRQDGRVTVTFFGDGAVEEGVFYESLNFAALKRLPIVFVCENNYYSSHLELKERQPQDNIYERAGTFGLPTYRGDGNNILDVMESAGQAIMRARQGDGPTFLEYQTYRWRGHVGANLDLELGIRSKETLESWMQRCPIKLLEGHFQASGLLSESDMKNIKEEVRELVEKAHTSALKAQHTEAADFAEHVYG